MTIKLGVLVTDAPSNQNPVNKGIDGNKTL
jgi:hypothetical protein